MRHDAPFAAVYALESGVCCYRYAARCYYYVYAYALLLYYASLLYFHYAAF